MTSKPVTSTDQQQASRENGKQSHGPKTPEGKAASSLNAVKYGFFARDPLLPGECADAFTAFSAPLLASLAPAGHVEQLLAGRIVDAALLDKDAVRASASPDTSIGRAFIHDSKDAGTLTRLSRYEAGIERGLFRTLHELQHLQAARAGQNAILQTNLRTP